MEELKSSYNGRSILNFLTIFSLPFTSKPIHIEKEIINAAEAQIKAYEAANRHRNILDDTTDSETSSVSSHDSF